MTEFVSLVIRGIPIGCVFALMAVGIVLTYKTSGVFNLAFGAQAFVSAAIYYDLVARRDWNTVLAFALAVLIVGPLLGLMLDRILYRHLRTAPPLARLVTSLGLLVAIPQMVKLWFGQGAAFNPPGLIESTHVYRLGEFSLDVNQVTTIVVTVLVVVGLTVLFRSTNLGLQMRAVVESPRMTELNGVNADRVGGVSWMLSSLFAGLAGVLLAPLFAQVSEVNFVTLLVAALAAAAFGRLSSIPLTFAGGLLLGILTQLLAGYLPTDSVLSTGLRPSLPFLVLFALLLFWPGLRDRPDAADPLRGVDPPPPAPPAAIRSPGLTLATRIFGAAFVVGGTLVALTVLDPYWLSLVIKGAILGIIFLSFTVLTGLGGQISLCQATFAAIGAFATAQLVDATGMSVLVAMVLGAVVAGVVGAALALPTRNLGGIYLALATLAFALMFEYVLKPLDWVGGGIRPPKVPRPVIGPVDLTDDGAFLLLVLVLLAVVATFVLLIRYGTTGRFLDALRGSEVAAASIGIDPARAKLTAFALSAAIAGFGGGLLASFEGRVNYDANFTYVFGLVWVVLVVTLGARSVQAAINAGLSFFLVPPLLALTPLSPGAAQSVAFILFGLGAVTYARHPEGIIEAHTRRAVLRIMRTLDRGDAPVSADEPAAADTIATSTAGVTR
jgi:branched-subunit amino acid ABC-type transport system permease component